MRRLRHTILATTVAAAIGAAACGGSSSTSNIAAPTGTVVTETFTGTVQQSATNVHSFMVTTPGLISVTLTAAGPPATITMGLGIGNPSASGNCIFLSGGTTQATANATTPQLSGNLTSSGAYCVAIGDLGNAAGPITYSITVSHT